MNGQSGPVIIISMKRTFGTSPAKSFAARRVERRPSEPAPVVVRDRRRKASWHAASCAALILVSAYALYEWCRSELPHDASKDILFIGVVTAMFAAHQFGKAIGWRARSEGCDSSSDAGGSGEWLCTSDGDGGCGGGDGGGD